MGNRIREWRDKRDMTLEDLADAAGLSASYVSRMETSKRNVSLKNLAKLAKALVVTEAELVETGGSGALINDAAELWEIFTEAALSEVLSPDHRTAQEIHAAIRGIVDARGNFSKGLATPEQLLEYVSFSVKQALGRRDQEKAGAKLLSHRPSQANRDEKDPPKG